MKDPVNLMPVHARHKNVTKNKIGRLNFCQGYAFITSTCSQYLETCCFKKIGSSLKDQPVVFNNKDLLHVTNIITGFKKTKLFLNLPREFIPCFLSP